MNEQYFEVDFALYCGRCKHCGTAETEDPCHECLEKPMNIGSRKPIRLEEKES